MGSRWSSMVVLLVSLGVTLGATYIVRELTRQRELAKFEHATDRLQQSIQGSLDKYLTFVDSVRAFTLAKVSMTAPQFHDYVKALHLPEKYPGIEGLGIALKFDATQKEKVIDNAKKRGIANFRVWPASDYPQICPLLLIEAQGESNLVATGFDVFAEENHRKAALRATDTGDAAATAIGALPWGPTNSAARGFSILMPGYLTGAVPATVEERRTNVAGFIYCAFQTESLLRAVVAGATNTGIGLRIYDGGTNADAALIYKTEDWPESLEGHFVGGDTMTVGGRTWKLEYASNPGLMTASNPAPFTLLGGLALSGLLWGITVSQTRAREAAEKHALALRESEARVREVNAKLEQRVAERTAELESSVEELKSFSYSVSHDLRAPLRHIGGFVNLLRENPTFASDDKARRHMATIETAAQQMGQLIDALLKFSHLGQVNLAVTPDVDLNEIVCEARETALPPNVQRAIEWKIAPLPKVTADPTLLRQVFANLISNAVKYSGPRSPAVIEIGSQDLEKEIQFFVKDNGVGFDMTYAGKLFGVFQRLHQQNEFEGTGIGLANIRRIIARHGGRTWAEGEVGKGATFYFTLPKRN